MTKQWEDWLKKIELPSDIHWYLIDNQRVFYLSHYGVYYVYLSDSKDTIVRGFRLDPLDTQQTIERKVRNAILQIQIDISQPKSYKSYMSNGKQHIVAP